MLRRERLHAVDREEELEIHWLLAPERAVVVERGDAFLRRNKVGRAFLGDLSDEVSNRLLRCAVVPRGKRIGGGPRNRPRESPPSGARGGGVGFLVRGFLFC